MNFGLFLLYVSTVFRLFFHFVLDLRCSVLFWFGGVLKIIGTRSRCMGFGVRIIYLLTSIPTYSLITTQSCYYMKVIG